jgi:hypothetical protein
MSEDHIQKAREAGLAAVARIRASGVIPEIKSTPKLKWDDATDAQKLEYLYRKVQALEEPWPPNPFGSTQADQLWNEKRFKEIGTDLDVHLRRIKALEEWQAETKPNITKIWQTIVRIIAKLKKQGEGE